MKKMICFIIVVALMITPASSAFAESHHDGHHHTKYSHSYRNRESYKESKNEGLRFINYGRYKQIVHAVTEDMGATVSFDYSNAVLTVTKDTIAVGIDYKNEIVTVNGVEDTYSRLFTIRDSKKTKVLIYYLYQVLGVRDSHDSDWYKPIVNVSRLDRPTNIKVTPVGAIVRANTLNSSTMYMTATATITPGQATGGRAELYVGSRLVAVDNAITATDTAIQFTTTVTGSAITATGSAITATAATIPVTGTVTSVTGSAIQLATPANAEMQAAVPFGGTIIVKLYNANNDCVTSKAEYPLVVDYAAPTIAGITSAVYNTATNQIRLNVTGACMIGDKVDVTKISIYDTALGKSYQLTNTPRIGSTGFVYRTNVLIINLGSADRLGMSDFGSTTMSLTITTASLLTDNAGNSSIGYSSELSLPITVINW